MKDLNETASPGPEEISPTAIAVVGLSLRFPGAADARRFWSNLSSGVESISILDAARRAEAGLPTGVGWVSAMGVLEGAESFDAAFFGFSPREAELMDPQHRLFLECAWGALESAGYAPRSRPLRAGVYAGASFSTYLLSNLLPVMEREPGGAFEGVLNTSGDFLATRVSYELDLTGPGLTVQTACSTSLVAVHLACQALIAGECELALAGGSSVRLPQPGAYRYQEGGILSRDGHCRPFDAAATGTVGGNGVGVVVLKRLSEALADGDPIRAVILGTAINNDGSMKTGYPAPSVTGQAAVIREALSLAGVEPASISYIETHGTATPLGDPIEVTALKQVFQGVAPGSCGIGSLKGNLGHLDAAAGIAGFIKAVLALENRLLPPSLHFQKANPRLGLEGSPFYVVSQPRPWTAGAGPRRAGVSAFGLGGTNAHAVLEEAPRLTSGEPRRPEELLLLSAKSEAALERMTSGLAEHLGQGGERLADVAHTLQVGRSRFPWRRFVISGQAGEAARLLQAGAEERVRTAYDETERRSAAFLFPGGGAQRVNMGAGFLSEPAFREAIDACARVTRGLLGGDLREVMFAGPERLEAASRELERPQWVLPALFACEWALAQLWLSWGVKPEALLGHSLGEYVAACLAGVFSLEDALTLVVARGRLSEQLPPGGMLSVLAPASELEPLLGTELSLAAINGPASCVVSGPLGALEPLEHTLVARGLSCKRVRYARAMHSSMLDPYLADYERVVARVRLGAPKLPVVSSVTGQWLSERESTDPSYWVRHLRQTVRFSDALALLLGQEERALIEVGPGTILGSFARQHPARTSQPVIASLPNEPAGQTSPLVPLGEAWLAGVQVDWARFRAGERRRRVPLPTYSFDRERYWIEPAAPAPAQRRAEPRPPPPASFRRTARKGAAVEPARNETERALVECFRELFRIEELGIHDDFFALGGDSLLALKLTARISERLGVRLALQAVLEAPTVAALAKRLGDTGAPRTARPEGLLQLQEGTQGTPLFFVHAAGGQSLFYRELARCIDSSRPVHAFESVGLEAPERCHGSVEEMAAHYLEGLRSVQPSGPYLLIGASFGGMIAYEMARRLSAEGHAVPLCAQLDTPGPKLYAGRFSDEADALAYVVRSWWEVPPERLRELSPEDRLQRALEEARRAGIEELCSDLERGRRVLRVWTANTLALSRYEIPRWEQGELQFFRAAEREADLPEYPELEWIGRGASVRVDVVPGGHTSMLQPPHVERLAAHLRALLERARV